MDASKSQAYYEAMTLWDEYMAASIAGYVSPSPKPGAGVVGAPSTGTERMVVLVGTNHVRGRVGIPLRFSRRTGLSTFVVIPAKLAPGDDGEWPGDIGEPNLETEADWVLFTPASPGTA